MIINPTSFTAVLVTIFLLPIGVAAQSIDWSNWETDTSKKTINLDELQSGGPPKDGIPSIDQPAFISPKAASNWLKPEEPVIVYGNNNTWRAYPLQIMIWHEIVNDKVAGKPVLVSFCPLCNSSLVFSRTLDGKVHDFGVSGFLRNSDLVMYDRQTESLWQQFTGEGIVGQYTGRSLKQLPSQVISFRQFREQYPDGEVLSKETGYRRDYGRNPYAGYDDINNNPFMYDGEEDGRLKPMARVLAVHLEGETKGYPFKITREAKIVMDTFAGLELVIFHSEGAVSALDNSRIEESREIGSTGVFKRELDGRKLSFKIKNGNIVDEETGTTWNVTGKAVNGPLKGNTLEPVTFGEYFAFALFAFYPEVTLYEK